MVLPSSVHTVQSTGITAEHSLRPCLQIMTTFWLWKFSAQLETVSKFAHSTIANKGNNMYVIDKRPKIELYASLAIRILIVNSCIRWRCSFKGLSQNGECADFSKNLCSSLFNKDLSNEPIFRPDPSRWTGHLILHFSCFSVSAVNIELCCFEDLHPAYGWHEQ